MKNKHAILIMCYDIKQVKWLLQRFDCKEFDIFLHIDKKTRYNPEYIKKIVKISSLHIYSDIKVYWGDISQTMCQINLLEKALKCNEYSYYHLLSENDTPLKSNSEIFNFFENSGKNFVHFESKYISKEKRRFIQYYYLFQKHTRHSFFFKKLEQINLLLQKILKINRCKSKEKYSTGANWFSIRKDLAEYIVKNKEKIYKRYKYTRSSDEFYLQTLIINSDFINTLFYTGFDNNYIACQRYIDWDKGNPYVFQQKDINELLKSGFCFARKVTDVTLRKSIEEKIQK